MCQTPGKSQSAARPIDSAIFGGGGGAEWCGSPARARRPDEREEERTASVWLIAPPSLSSAIGDVLDGRLAGHLLRFRRGLGGSGVLCRLEPVADADGDRSGRLDGMRGENRAASACRDDRECGEAADGDEHGRERGHHLGVLDREKVERVAGVEQPERSLRHRCGDCVMRDRWQSVT